MNRANIGNQQTVKMSGDMAMTLYYVRDLFDSQEGWVAHRKRFRLALVLSGTLNCQGRPNFVTTPPFAARSALVWLAQHMVICHPAVTCS